MRINWFGFLIQMLGICSVFFWLGLTTEVQAEPLTSHETNGTVSFYGTYESENKPQPNPPDGGRPSLVEEPVRKPVRGTLPQLGQLFTQQWMWIVFIILGFSYVYWKKRERKAT